jgi:hypothetical protein
MGVRFLALHGAENYGRLAEKQKGKGKGGWKGSAGEGEIGGGGDECRITINELRLKK